MITVKSLRTIEPHIVMIGSHPGIIQSILDFDYLSEKKTFSIKGIVAAGRKFERYFFGKREIVIPVYQELSKIPEDIRNSTNYILTVTSARRVLSSTKESFEVFPKLLASAIFAENVPEKHALELFHLAGKKGIPVMGPASVGMVIPGILKLGAIGGTDWRQLLESHLTTPGNTAVFSASGGMTNEIIRIATNSGKRISFALHFGGDRFPIMEPVDAFLAAQNDDATEAIIYYGELGGLDEYKVAELIKKKEITKPVITYIAGTISDLFKTPPQFGHAKAIARGRGETAREKRDVLKDSGASVPESFEEFVSLIKTIPARKAVEKEYGTINETMDNRRHALVTTSISKDEEGVATVLGEELLSFSQKHSFAYIVTSLFLGRKIKSAELEEFVDFVLRILVDHGPYVSGAVNTIITSRAGKDLVSSLAAGLLTIGPRFGGAINQAAFNWILGVTTNKSPGNFVEEFAEKKQYIAGIGHKKYRNDFPDPRVEKILSFSEKLSEKRFTAFAREVEKITTSKKGNLILNVDGAIAAVLLDLLSEKEKYSNEKLQELVEAEFFNTFFVLSRSVGFIGHFLDQKRLDEGLFRLDEDLVVEAKIR